MFRLAAPHTWVASAGPAVFGIVYSLLSGYHLSPLMAAGLFAACILMQSAVNMLNDYTDFVNGTDTTDDFVEVSDAVLVYEHVNPKHVRTAGMTCLAAAATIGVIVTVYAGFVPLLIGMIGGAAVLCYSGGPKPLSYLPVGEIVSGFVMGGLIPAGIAAAAAGRMVWNVFCPSLPFMIGIALIMLSNNGSDIEKDRSAGRNTLPALLGRRYTVLLNRFLSVAWLALICLLPIWMTGWIGLAALVLVLLFGRRVFREQIAADLMPENRIHRMKGVAQANFVGNGAYTAALILYLAMEEVRIYG